MFCAARFGSDARGACTDRRAMASPTASASSNMTQLANPSVQPAAVRHRRRGGVAQRPPLTDELGEVNVAAAVEVELLDALVEQLLVLRTRARTRSQRALPPRQRARRARASCVEDVAPKSIFLSSLRSMEPAGACVMRRCPPGQQPGNDTSAVGIHGAEGLRVRDYRGSAPAEQTGARAHVRRER
jgi:hypothetical protein